jgi:hypothetical protein
MNYEFKKRVNQYVKELFCLFQRRFYPAKNRLRCVHHSYPRSAKSPDSVVLKARLLPCRPEAGFYLRRSEDATPNRGMNMGGRRGAPVCAPLPVGRRVYPM